MRVALTGIRDGTFGDGMCLVAFNASEHVNSPAGYWATAHAFPPAD